MCLKTIRTKSLKNPKTWIFSKGLVHGFVKKCKILPCFYLVHGCSQKYEVWPLVKIRHVSLFDNILDRKKPFKTIKTEVKKVDKLGFF